MTATLPPHKIVYSLGWLSRIPLGEGRTFLVEGTLVAVFRTHSGKVFATQANCPHKGGALSNGLLNENTIVCPLHALKFDLTNGEPPDNTCQALRTYQVTVSGNGELLLSLE